MKLPSLTRSLLALPFILAIGGTARAEDNIKDILKSSDVPSPTDLDIFKWDFERQTTDETVAVMRVEHWLAGTMIKEYETLHYSRNFKKLGSLLIFSAQNPMKIMLPGGNQERLEVDERSEGIREGGGKVECLDGEKRDTRYVEIVSENETLRFSFYSAPMEIFRKKIPTLPDPKKDETSGFRWRHDISDNKYVISRTKINGKEKISVHVTPKNAEAEK